jgi:hypothetical protein
MPHSTSKYCCVASVRLDWPFGLIGFFTAVSPLKLAWTLCIDACFIMHQTGEDKAGSSVKREVTI